MAALSDVQVGTPGDEAWAIVDGEQAAMPSNFGKSDACRMARRLALADTVRKVACP